MKTNKRFVLVNADSDNDSDFRPAPSQEEISVVAHQIYEEEGCPEGCADSHWYAAEARLSE